MEMDDVVIIMSPVGDGVIVPSDVPVLDALNTYRLRRALDSPCL